MTMAQKRPPVISLPRFSIMYQISG
jgi:hypothetical protein